MADTVNIFDEKPNLFIGVNKNSIKKSKEVDIPYKKLDFSKYSFKGLLLSIILIISLGIFSIITKPNLGVDFTGGTSINLEYNSEYNDEIINMFNKEYSVRKISISDNNVNIILSDTLGKDEINDLNTKILNEYNINSDISVVSKVVKVELTKNAVKSLIYAIIGIIIYVGIRFRFNYAISAIIALIHDILITFLLFILFKE